ncbi:MAG: PIN domain-containing protein [Betaproteobacteria bacterium]|nr:PIN domain-containing protein [Betaproteobacteria bacterium]
MRCFIDSNVLISAGLFPGSVPAAALEKAINPPNTAFVSDYSLDECHRVAREKFPNRVRDLEIFLYRTLFTVQLVKTPTDYMESDESKVSDVKDRPILRAALSIDADVLITGDKKLIASDISHPRILNPADFIR